MRFKTKYQNKLKMSGLTVILLGSEFTPQITYISSRLKQKSKETTVKGWYYIDVGVALEISLVHGSSKKINNG